MIIIITIVVVVVVVVIIIIIIIITALTQPHWQIDRYSSVNFFKLFF